MPNKIEELLNVVKESFIFTLNKTGEKKEKNRSSKKVDPIHGVIARHINNMIGEEYIVETKDTTHREINISGKFIDKKVDLGIVRKSDGKIIAGVGVKYIMSSYDKNRNNYFENMLGETANIRSNNCSYFQILLLPYKIPNFKKNGLIQSYSSLSDKTKHLYQILSKENSGCSLFVPDKTLLMVLDNIPECDENLNKNERANYYIDKNNYGFFTIRIHQIDNNMDCDNRVVVNNYDLFLKDLCYIIKNQS